VGEVKNFDLKITFPEAVVSPVGFNISTSGANSQLAIASASVSQFGISLSSSKSVSLNTQGTLSSNPSGLGYANQATLDLGSVSNAVNGVTDSGDSIQLLLSH